jgi:mRNA interferase MazF
MENEYDSWNTVKKNIANNHKQVFCKTRDIWWCSVGMNIGTEIYGKNEMFERPILVLKVYNKETVLGLPLSTKIKLGI